MGVTPMAVYYYVKSKDEMFELLADAVMSRVERAAPGSGDWRSQLKQTSLNAFKLLCEDPGLSGQIVKQPPTHQAEQMSTYGTAILIDAGYPPATAARMITTCQSFMYGMIGLQAQIERAKRVKQPTRVSTAYLAQLDAYDIVAEGLDALLTGLAAQLPKPTRATKKRTRAL